MLCIGSPRADRFRPGDLNPYAHAQEPSLNLPAHISVADFDALHDDTSAWHPWVLSLAQSLGESEIEPFTDGTVLVARIGAGRVLKLYPPFLRDHFEFERALLLRLHGRLSVPTPALMAYGETQGWPYLVMQRLEGEPLTQTWPAMAETQRVALLHELGKLTTELHALPVAEEAQLAPPWSDFIRSQRERCPPRQQRTGLPSHLMAQLPAFIAGPLPEGPPVLLTGEYTPMNLFTLQHRLCAMFDFGDGMVGPREYDWLGPLAFLAAGNAARCHAFMAGAGQVMSGPLRLRLLRLLLLHRYSNLPAQLACPGWQAAPHFEALAERLWPLG